MVQLLGERQGRTARERGECVYKGEQPGECDFYIGSTRENSHEHTPVADYTRHVCFRTDVLVAAVVTTLVAAVGWKPKH